MTSENNPECNFCQIIAGKSPAEILFEDDNVIIFKDIKPASKFHYLAVPKTHIKSIKELTKADRPLVENLVVQGRTTIKNNGGDENNMITGFHCPPFNTVNHLHLHLITPTSEMSILHRMIFKSNTLWFVTADYVLNDLLKK